MCKFIVRYVNVQKKIPKFVLGFAKETYKCVCKQISECADKSINMHTVVLIGKKNQSIFAQRPGNTVIIGSSPL